MIEVALVPWLKSDTGVGQLINGRLYPQKAPERKSVSDPKDAGAFPHITYYRASTAAVYSQDGVSPLESARVTLDCWALTYGEAKRLAQKVKQATGPTPSGSPLSGFRGKMGAYTVGGVFHEDERDDYTPPAHSDDVGVYRTSLDFMIWFQNIPI